MSRPKSKRGLRGHPQQTGLGFWLCFGAKEDALKALHVGPRLDTRRVIVSSVDASLDLNGWSPLQVRFTDDRVFPGWWQHTDHTVRTLVADPPADSPILLKIPAHSPDSPSRSA